MIDELPFDLSKEIGKITRARLESPGVYLVITCTEQKDPNLELVDSEYYIVTEDAPAISKEAKAYGKTFPDHPGLWVFEYDNEEDGSSIIGFEVCRYQRLQHLPENGDSLHTHAIYSMELYPEYFGAIPAPAVTPRGNLIRYKTLANGIFWIETDRCE